MAYANNAKPAFTDHARRRMSGRSINETQIAQVMQYGRSVHTRKALIYAIGRQEIKEHGKFLTPCEGIHVLCSPNDGVVITTYRNRDLSGAVSSSKCKKCSMMLFEVKSVWSEDFSWTSEP